MPENFLMNGFDDSFYVTTRYTEVTLEDIKDKMD